MSRGFRNSIFGGSGSLVIPQIQSPNYSAGVAGWQIRKDGTAEFNQGTFRGGVIVAGASGEILVYSPTAGLGNLIFSLSAAAGTDSFGNNFPAGIGVAIAASALGKSAIQWGSAGTDAYLSRWFDVPTIDSVLQLAGPQQKAALTFDHNSATVDSITLALGSTGYQQNGLINLIGGVALGSGSSSAINQILFGTFAAVFSASAASAGTLTFPHAFASTPVVTSGVQVGSNLDINFDWQAIGAGSASWRAFQNTNVAVTGTATIQWCAIA